MSALLDIAVGLLTVFLIFSILVSGINEWLAQRFARRGEYLRIGLQRLIGDDAIYRRVLHHPMVGGLYRERAAQGKPPSYIEPGSFAMALADVVLARARAAQPEGGTANPPLTMEALRAALRTPALAASPIALSLGPVIERADANLSAALKGIEDWFNSGMDRVSGWYKTRTRWMLFWIGLALAALCNVDTIEIAATLNRSPALRGSLAALGSGIVETGKVGSVTLADLRDRAPTDEEWRSMRPVLEGVRTASGTLPIGYACLGAVTDAPAALSAAASAPAATAASAPAAAASKALRDVLRGCAKQARQNLDAGGVLKLLGWLLTAVAGTMGAGYWFNLLSKAINIRGTGPKPEPAKP